MAQRTVVLDLASDHQLARDLVAGGVFVREVLALGEDCTVVLRNDATAIELHATVVYVDHATRSLARRLQELYRQQHGPKALHRTGQDSLRAEDIAVGLLGLNR